MVRQWGARLLRPFELVESVSRDRGLFQLVALGVFGFGLTMLLAILANVLYDDWQNSLYLLIFSPIAVSLLSGFMRIGSTAGSLAVVAKREIVRVMLHRRCCPACTYLLQTPGASEEPASKDAGNRQALVRCPECGSQWSAARLGTLREPPAVVVVIRTSVPPKSTGDL
jgi:hypothetical protein